LTAIVFRPVFRQLGKKRFAVQIPLFLRLFPLLPTPSTHSALGLGFGSNPSAVWEKDRFITQRLHYE